MGNLSYEKQIKESLSEKQAKACARAYRTSGSKELHPKLTEAELYYLYKHLYQGKEGK